MRKGRKWIQCGESKPKSSWPRQKRSRGFGFCPLSHHHSLCSSSLFSSPTYIPLLYLHLFRFRLLVGGLIFFSFYDHFLTQRTPPRGQWRAAQGTMPKLPRFLTSLLFISAYKCIYIYIYTLFLLILAFTFHPSSI